MPNRIGMSGSFRSNRTAAPSFNGRTADSGSAYRGSNPWGAANKIAGSCDPTKNPAYRVRTVSVFVTKNPVTIFWLQPFGFEDLDGFIYGLWFVRGDATGEQHNGEHGGDSCFHVSRYRSSLISELATAGDKS